MFYGHWLLKHEKNVRLILKKAWVFNVCASVCRLRPALISFANLAKIFIEKRFVMKIYGSYLFSLPLRWPQLLSIFAQAECTSELTAHHCLRQFCYVWRKHNLAHFFCLHFLGISKD